MVTKEIGRSIGDGSLTKTAATNDEAAGAKITF